MTSKTALARQQIDWALRSGLNPDARGYLSSVDSNLLQPLSQQAREAFMSGSGSELQSTKARPAKMAALHSSAALAVNVFDYWSGRNISVIGKLLGLAGDVKSLTFESQFPTGLEGNPPNLDVAFALADGRVVGVESKFSEWLTPKSARKVPFKPKYFAENALLWARVGLANVQRIASALQDREYSFRYLDAPQLLKHMLGLASVKQGSASLYYIFYDWPGRESAIHRSEIEQFCGLIGRDMPVSWGSYQDFFARMKNTLGKEHTYYVEYLEQRYFQNAV